MNITTGTISETVTRPILEDLILALVRSERWAHEGDFRAAMDEIRDVREVLGDELNRLQLRRERKEKQ